MKLNRAIVVALCLTVGVACLWAAQTAPAPASAPAATAAVPTPAPAPAAAATPALPKMEFKSDMEKVSYAIGCRLAMNLKSRKDYIDVAMVIKGFTEVVNGQTPAVTEQEMQQLITAWDKDVQTKMTEKNAAEGKAFLDANAKKEGVKVLTSGLQYKVVKDGTGNAPTASDRVKVHYKGTLTDGTKFDSSYDRNQPAEFMVGGVIKGWTEALQLMKEGAKWEIYIPANLAYGESGRSSIPPNSVLIFEVELLEVIKTPAAAVPGPGGTVITPSTPAPATRSGAQPQANPQ